MKIDLPPEKSAELLKKINICFLFAQNYHIAMKYVAPIRKELGSGRFSISWGRFQIRREPIWS